MRKPPRPSLKDAAAAVRRDSDARFAALLAATFAFSLGFAFAFALGQRTSTPAPAATPPASGPLEAAMPHPPPRD